MQTRQGETSFQFKLTLLVFDKLTNHVAQCILLMSKQRVHSEPSAIQSLKQNMRNLIHSKMTKNAIRTLQASPFLSPQKLALKLSLQTQRKQFFEKVESFEDSFFIPRLLSQPPFPTIKYESPLEINKEAIHISQPLNLSSQHKPRLTRQRPTVLKKPSNLELPYSKSPNPRKKHTHTPSPLRKGKKSNTLLFSFATKKMPFKRPMKLHEERMSWEAPLLEKLNLIQGSKDKKHNLRIDRDKLSNSIEKACGNDVITTFFRHEQIENFDVMKSTVEKLIFSPKKQLKFIAFLTYDFNKDGFICQEDLYYFLQNLPQSSKMFEDIKTIMAFLRKNRVRSENSGLSENILKRRDKRAYQAQFNRQAKVSDEDSSRASKQSKLTERLFLYQKRRKTQHEEEQDNLSKQATKDKRYQINFQVFCLIFLDQLPAAIGAMIDFLTEPAMSPEPLKRSERKEETKTDQEDETSATEWIDRMSHTRQLLHLARRQSFALSKALKKAY